MKHKFNLGDEVVVTDRIIKSRYPRYFDFNCKIVKVGVEKTDKGELFPAYEVNFKGLPFSHFMREDWIESIDFLTQKEK